MTKLMGNLTISAVLLVNLFYISPAFAQQNIVSFGSVINSTTDPDHNTYGFEFTVTSPIVVIGLSAWDSTPSSGMSSATPVGLWNSSGILLASNTVAAGKVDPLTSDGQFRYVLLSTQLVLGDGNYYVGSPVASDATAVSGLTSISGVTFIGPAYYDRGGLNFPSAVMPGVSGNFGGDVVFETTPEPVSLCLFGFGLLGATFLQWTQARFYKFPAWFATL